MWSHTSQRYNNYGHHPSVYGARTCSGGCRCDETKFSVENCFSTSVYIRSYVFHNFTDLSFRDTVQNM